MRKEDSKTVGINVDQSKTNVKIFHPVETGIDFNLTGPKNDIIYSKLKLFFVLNLRRKHHRTPIRIFFR